MIRTLLEALGNEASSQKYIQLANLWERYGNLLEKSDHESKADLVPDAFLQAAEYLRMAISDNETILLSEEKEKEAE